MIFFGTKKKFALKVIVHIFMAIIIKTLQGRTINTASIDIELGCGNMMEEKVQT